MVKSLRQVSASHKQPAQLPYPSAPKTTIFAINRIKIVDNKTIVIK
jgi:hypothetical protein